MAFKFSLATALRVREVAEQREKRLLGQIIHQIAQGRQTLAELDAEHRGIVAHRERTLQETTSAADIVASYERIRRLEEAERQARDQLAKLTTLREQQMRNYEAAHRSRELLSGIRSDQLYSFERERTRREQNAMDDGFSSRWRPC